MATDLRLSTIGDLNGRVALVTGGGTGIGFIMARALATNGAKVYITGRRREKLDEAAGKENTGTGYLVALSMDVLSKDSIKNAVQTIEEADGKLDILINKYAAYLPFPHLHLPLLPAHSAGVVGPFSAFLLNRSPQTPSLGASLFADQTFEQWGDAFASNTIAPFFVTTAFLDLLQKGADARPGETSSVINISSSFAHTDLSMGVLAYGASKVAVEQITKSLATEFALHHIPVRVNAIAPGTFPSDMTGSRDALTEVAKRPIPGAFEPAPVLRPGREAELAFTTVYLASSAGGYTNGHVLVMDGGWGAVNP
ncbi:Rhamnolipids biosynthesis 3-oxoacyl-[acyl-carrier-protein] reductase [Hypsizygus marmoreus]|uniref:Rhamnolipids biosynthesis 3-oxoacyl-[acyl-carrier-protein] reductase n=1 Tax=Hypsizygus marmoreus TaxID=39966 RepID=A0A369J8Q7_HYPMA|nr:Rhamnolipids biosynthesis 3-oxoacyl-[acyl-carrier-protein] reductase [Hypsizygus marmoreus]